MEGSQSVAELFTHIHYVRLVFVFEDAPEFARKLPEEEWLSERDADRIAQMLNESAKAVRDAVKSRVEAGRDMDLHSRCCCSSICSGTRATVTARLSWRSRWQDAQSSIRRLGRSRGASG
jgi:hypothetical protein